MSRKSRIYFAKVAFLAILILSLLFSACSAEVTDSPPSSDLPVYSIHTEAQNAFLTQSLSLSLLLIQGKEELSRPLPIHLDLSDLSQDCTKVEVSESEDFSPALLFPVTEGQAEIYNLKIGTTYYYRAVEADGRRSRTERFQTESIGPRNLYIDGVTNARDLGGYETALGRIRQGLLYRTAKLNQNKASTPTPLITEEGIKTMKEVLQVKSEIDLRKSENNEIGSLTGSVLGEGVHYYNLPMGYDNVLTENEGALRDFFALLADEKNYPIFFHCSIGTDRTGYSAFLILSLLGADTNVITKDYLFSNFGLIGGSRSASNVLGFSFFLALQKGSSPMEKAENYLIKIGVTREEIDSIRRIMIEA